MQLPAMFPSRAALAMIPTAVVTISPSAFAMASETSGKSLHHECSVSRWIPAALAACSRGCSVLQAGADGVDNLGLQLGRPVPWVWPGGRGCRHRSCWSPRHLHREHGLAAVAHHRHSGAALLGLLHPVPFSTVGALCSDSHGEGLVGEEV